MKSMNASALTPDVLHKIDAYWLAANYLSVAQIDLVNNPLLALLSHSFGAVFALFTKDNRVIFAFHAYPWLIHRLTYRRTNHDNIDVRGYKEEGTITIRFLKVLADAGSIPGIKVDTAPTTRPAITLNVRFESRLPWAFAFSFARAIQQPAMEIWQRKEANVNAAQQAFLHRAKCHRAARRGEYSAAMATVGFDNNYNHENPNQYRS